MSDRKKGFDPLSSLFDAPDPGAVKPDLNPSAMDLTEPSRKFARPGSIPDGLDEDAPTEMATVPKAADLPEERDEIAGAGPLKKRSASDGNMEFIGELPASDDWTESKPEALFSLNQPPVPDPDEEVAPRYGQRLSRVERLAARAVRPKSALEAAREAAQNETEAQEQASQTLTERIQVLIEASLPGVGSIEVNTSKVADEREVLLALWKSHRTKFLGDGQLERAVAAAQVVDSLKHAPEGALLAAHAVTEASDYLIWIDLQNGSLVAAFADARSYFAG